ncbi:hypothetical protein GGI15_001577 [Coemansia interrupta]|uniref:YABBY protein C-terminal domain-containing protein n=1 Tax=Coemansia interrupta TaxID=1126814 RepID=A0A9W8HHP3_9FUNG|nr:hypothetical protein GGI15_001577 [Coemansia interrupta]
MGRSAKTSKRGKANNSPYNVFFTRELKRIKAENPEMPHKEAFTQAALNWRTSPENPKNKTADGSAGAAALEAAPASKTATAGKPTSPATATTVSEAIAADITAATVPKAASSTAAVLPAAIQEKEVSSSALTPAASDSSAVPKMHNGDVVSNKSGSGIVERKPTPIGGETAALFGSTASPFGSSAMPPLPSQTHPAVPSTGSTTAAKPLFPSSAPHAMPGLSSIPVGNTDGGAASELAPKESDDASKQPAGRKDSAASADDNAKSSEAFMNSHSMVSGTPLTVSK